MSLRGSYLQWFGRRAGVDAHGRSRLEDTDAPQTVETMRRGERFASVGPWPLRLTQPPVVVLVNEVAEADLVWRCDAANAATTLRP